MIKALVLSAAVILSPSLAFAQKSAGCSEVPGQGMFCNGIYQFQDGIELPPASTVALLPTCNAGARGQLRVVTDATSPAYNATIAGAGAVITMVMCNGTNWTAH